ncbi:Uncharacterised protein [Mycobacteroides abscessus subsp. abscessus]|uniref:hypothetical protein n=1 Tax=Mycobacteroides abscessus TaxID=36809 RepID=UPI000929852B|nr:hypothetical protein [Mycobacteroides abscessus]SIC63001.1 Uncharacterised protein [Mycobacteroides abscessus subsp. abscessus]SIG63815.1 Uncharacterised protein [Mycobacteroides abscessus subsp. abscessus]
MTEKRRTRTKAAVAGVALTALLGGMLAVDVASHPAPQEKTPLSSVPADDYTAEWGQLKREAVDEGWTQAQLQEAKDAARSYACVVDLSDDPTHEVEAKRTAEKLAAGCTEPLPYTI